MALSFVFGLLLGALIGYLIGRVRAAPKPPARQPSVPSPPRPAAAVIPPAPGPQPAWLHGDGSYRLRVVGESHYQEALEALVGEDETGRKHPAELILDDANPYDRNAVEVRFGGRQVGYLDRQDALAFRERIQQEGLPLRRFSCRGKITGGEGLNYGAVLDVLLYG